MAREVAHLRVRVLADAYHVRQENEDLGSLAKVGPIAHVHIAQQAERLFPTDDDAQLANLFRKLTATGEHQAQLVTIDLGIQGAWLIAERWALFSSHLSVRAGVVR